MLSETYFKGKNILVTGGTGSIGSALVEKLISHKPNVIRVLSNDENSLFYLREKYIDAQKTYMRCIVGDVRDRERVMYAMQDIDICVHCAALKHVHLCELNPFDAIQTNVIGTKNVIESSIYNDVDKLINISTDKAVNPINTMGATKLLAERLVEDANNYKGNKKTILSNIRFGNVLFSRGSVIPFFIHQIKTNNTVTITNPDMTRFFMSINDALDLVMKAINYSREGELFILKMPVIRLGDLADVLIEIYGNKDTKKKTIGLREGEKMHECLMTEEESQVAEEQEDFFVINYRLKKTNGTSRIYSSQSKQCLNKQQIMTLLTLSKDSE